MNISADAQAWLENNITYIDSLTKEADVLELFDRIPANIFAEICTVLQNIDIPIISSEVDDGVVKYGIKSANGFRTVSVGKFDGSTYNINFTSSQGMVGGHQVGFTTLQSVMDFIQKFSDPSNYRPSKMVAKTVASYEWFKVSSIYGDCYITDRAKNAKKSPQEKQQKRQAYNKICTDVSNLFKQVLAPTQKVEITKEPYRLYVIFSPPIKSDVEKQLNAQISAIPNVVKCYSEIHPHSYVDIHGNDAPAGSAEVMKIYIKKQ